MDRPVLSSKGASGAELEPILSNICRKTLILGFEKWSREAILVDGCGRSAYRVVELVESKTVVLESKKSKKSKKVKRIQEIQDCH